MEDLPCQEEGEGEEAAEEASCSSIVKLKVRCAEWQNETPDTRKAGMLGKKSI